MSPISPDAATPRLRADEVTLSYDGRVVVSAVDLVIPDGQFTVIIGPNACGKSTILRALAGLLRPSEGVVVLDGKSIAEQPTKDVARRLGLLPQTASAPDGISVSELVARGRYPYQKLLRQWSEEDEAAVGRALELTSLTDLAARRVDELSGGQRQRVWIAMVLAQETPIILLDEPTTYLDIAHQLEVLTLLHSLNLAGRTIVAVLHDLNHAARYADHVVAMKDGAIIAAGPPETTITADLVKEVFGIGAAIIPDPLTGGPLVVPLDTRSSVESRP